MKIFAVSDIHGFYDEFIKTLNDVGFEKDNDEHLLVVCGDCWDRGTKPIEVMEFLMNLNNVVLIKGNHESLFEELVERGYPNAYDFSNGTFDTVCRLAGKNPDDVVTSQQFLNCCFVASIKAKPFLDKMINYLESKHYIFVHSFIPLKNEDGLPGHYTRNRKFSKMRNWRHASHQQWEDARWGNPFNLAKQGFLPSKSLIFGHWHASTGWAAQDGHSEFGEDAIFDPFYGDGYVAIDACTAHSGKMNVVVFEDDLLEVDNE